MRLQLTWTLSRKACSLPHLSRPKSWSKTSISAEREQDSSWVLLTTWVWISPLPFVYNFTLLSQLQIKTLKSSKTYMALFPTVENQQSNFEVCNGFHSVTEQYCTKWIITNSPYCCSLIQNSELSAFLLIKSLIWILSIVPAIHAPSPTSLKDPESSAHLCLQSSTMQESDRAFWKINTGPKLSLDLNHRQRAWFVSHRAQVRKVRRYFM